MGQFVCILLALLRTVCNRHVIVAQTVYHQVEPGGTFSGRSIADFTADTFEDCSLR